MQKAKIKIVVEVEFEQDPKYYPEGSTPEQMLAIDLQGVNDDPYLTMDLEGAKWTITGEIVEAN